MTAAADPVLEIDSRLDQTYMTASAAASDFVLARAVEVLRRLGFFDLGASPMSLAEVSAFLGVVESHQRALAWLLRVAGSRDAVTVARRAEGLVYAPGPGRSGGGLSSAPPQAQVDIVTRELVDWVADAYPDVLTGARSGAAVLFKGAARTRWLDYFSHRNPLYDVHNQLAWSGLERALDRTDRAPRVLELGAGTGGATEAVLTHWAQTRPGAELLYTVSDLSPALLFEVVERLGGLCKGLERRRLDFDRSFELQGIPDQSLDAVVAVNVLHNAFDLEGTWRFAGSALRAGGAIVVSESLCPEEGWVHQDFVFNLLGYPPGSSASEGGSRFLSATAWSRAFERCPYEVEAFTNSQPPKLALMAVVRVGRSQSETRRR